MCNYIDIPNTKYYKTLFERLFSLNKLEGESVLLKFESRTLKALLIYIAEFGFQIFKILCENDEYEWRILKKTAQNTVNN